MRSQRGQSTVEWVALLLLVALAMTAALAALGGRVPGGLIARAIVARLVCAARIEAHCSLDRALIEAYGEEMAALVEEHAPDLLYEQGMRALPVDFRRCRQDACAEGQLAGPAWFSAPERPVVAFVRAIDCRGATPAGANCSGARAGNVYLQYFFYYPGSATAEGGLAPGAVRRASSALGHPTNHADDWESYQVRIGPGGAESRASSHHGYVHAGGKRNWLSDIGKRRRPAWRVSTGRLFIAGGSHAGHVEGGGLRHLNRFTPAGRLALVPIETLGPARRVSFAVTPPWRKRVFSDPEWIGT